MANKTDKITKHLFNGDLHEMPHDYYLSNKANPNLRAFVEQHLKENPYDPQADAYSREPFDKRIETTKATAIYNMHAYWSKKPHDAIRQYILHYTVPGDLVLDQFCGSGGTALTALMEKRKAIAIDLSPAATFITANYVRPVNPEELISAGQALLSAFSETEESKFYTTRCHITDEPATLVRSIYSSRFRCNRCFEISAIWDCPEKEIDKRSSDGIKTTTVCPHCLAKGKLEELSATSEFIDRIVVASEYKTGVRGTILRAYNDTNKKARDYFEQYDLQLIGRAEKSPIRNWYPKRDMLDITDHKTPWGLLWRPYHHDMRTVSDFFTHRNLHVISTLFSCIATLEVREYVGQSLRFAITGILPGLSHLNRYRPEVSFPLNYSANTLYVPPVGTEENPIPHLKNKIKRLAEGYRELISLRPSNRCMISTQSACNLYAIQNNSVDYIFTDPPYGSRIQYGELNFLWESWLDASGDWRREEIIINESETRKRDAKQWARLFKKAMEEAYRVLKPGRWLSLCFHDSSTEIWEFVQDIMTEVGFIPDNLDKVVAIETDYKTHKQIVAKQIAKRDLVINFRKPRPGELNLSATFSSMGADEMTFRELAAKVIREHLQSHPGETKDRIYDELISRMVRAGQMEAHNFSEILSQIAEKVVQPGINDEASRWYLKDRELEVSDDAESAKEDLAAQKIGSFIKNSLAQDPEFEGVHYSDIFENYVYSIKDKPRRRLSDWLLDYFYKTEEGTYRLPISDEECELKKRARNAGTNRKIKRYIGLLEQGLAIPDKIRPNDATLADWIRQCKRSGLYEQGSLLYEKGGLNLDKLPEDVMVNVEEDYQVCVRMLARAGGIDKKTKQSRRKTSETEE